MQSETGKEYLRTLLEKATGKSEHVIVVNVDVRGFSTFCENVGESANVVLFITEVYKKLLDRYFFEFPFVKPTGDGLLMVLPYEKDTLPNLAFTTMKACAAAHNEFGSLCADNKMINFDVPGKIGIGVSRGAVSRIIANDRTLDYSGAVLNRASRLMNLARPSGIVFDAGFDLELLPSELQHVFSKAQVWLWGIAESVPIDIYYSMAYGTRIPEIFTKRLDVRQWATQKMPRITVKQLEKLTARKGSGGLVYRLRNEPVDSKEIDLSIFLPGRVRREFGVGYRRFGGFTYKLVSGRPALLINKKGLLGALRSYGLKKKDKILIFVRYPI